MFLLQEKVTKKSIFFAGCFSQKTAEFLNPSDFSEVNSIGFPLRIGFQRGFAVLLMWKNHGSQSFTGEKPWSQNNPTKDKGPNEIKDPGQESFEKISCKNDL